MKRFTYSIALAFFLLFSCDSVDVDIQEVNGRIFDATGMPGLDGCGWLVKINGAFYQPTYLNSQYRQDDFRVFMNVEFLNERADCGTLAEPPGLVRIEQIRPSSN